MARTRSSQLTALGLDLAGERNSRVNANPQNPVDSLSRVAQRSARPRRRNMYEFNVCVLERGVRQLHNETDGNAIFSGDFKSVHETKNNGKGIAAIRVASP